MHALDGEIAVSLGEHGGAGNPGRDFPPRVFSAHQPQYLPYLGFFHKIANSDVFILLDDVQYKKREFQNRNRVRTPGGWLWLTVPVKSKGRRAQTVADAAVDNSDDWRRSHWETLRHNYGKAPQFKRHAPFFEALYARSWERLEPLCRQVIDYLCLAYGIKVPFRKSSEFKLDARGTRRLIGLSRALGAKTYLSGPGGAGYIDETRFQEAGVLLRYQRFEHPRYEQAYPGFEENMSALDFLFNVDPIRAAAFFARPARRPDPPARRPGPPALRTR